MLWTVFIFNKSKNYQKDISKRQDIKNDDKRYQVVPRCDVSKMPFPLRCQLKRLCNVLSWSVSFRYQLLRCFDFSNWLVLFMYQWDASNRSVLLTYQLQHHADISAWSGTFRLVNKMGQYLLDTRKHVSLPSQVVQSL